MERQIKSIGVLTSGGDAPGMNAAVRAVVRTGIHKGYRMIGIQRGYNGLLNGECYEMNLRSVSNIIQDGGTILYTARCLEFKTPSCTPPAAWSSKPKKARTRARPSAVNWASTHWWSSAATVLTAAPASWPTGASR